MIKLNQILFLYCAQSLEWTKNLNEAKKFCPLIELPFLNSKLWLNFALKKNSNIKVYTREFSHSLIYI